MSRLVRLSLKEAMSIDIKSKVGSLGFAEMRAVVPKADAAPIRAELQLHCPFWPMILGGNYSLFFVLAAE